MEIPASRVRMGDFDVQDTHGGFPSQFVLGTHELHLATSAFPSATVTDAMFRPVDRNGYGLQLSRFVWTAFKPAAPPTQMTNCYGG